MKPCHFSCPGGLSGTLSSIIPIPTQMKFRLVLIPGICLTQLPLAAQVTVVPAPEEQAPPIVVESAPRAVRVLDPVEVRRRLSVAPRVVIVPAPAPAPPPVVEIVPEPAPPPPAAPPKVTKTTTRERTIIDTPGKPRRIYDSIRNVVVVHDKEQSREMPYVTLPVLFVKETAELLDAESRAALEQVAGVILAVSKAEPGTLFDIEGHTSTDGTDEFNMTLSAARSQRIYDELTKRYGVPPTALSAHGYGESFPAYPNGTEEQMQQDRRVLVVRTK